MEQIVKLSNSYEFGVACVAVLLNIIINIYAIKKIGAFGVDFTFTICSMIEAILLIIFSLKYIKYKELLHNIWKICVSSIFMLMIIIGCNFLWGEINLTNNLIISIIDICIGG